MAIDHARDKNKNTEIYIHIADSNKSQVKSPLNDILEGGI